MITENDGINETSTTATPIRAKNQNVHHLYFGSLVEKTHALFYQKSIKEEGKRGEPGYKRGQKAGVISSRYEGPLSFDAMRLHAKKMHEAGKIGIVQLEDGKYKGEQAYDMSSLESFAEMAEAIINFQDNRREKYHSGQKPSAAVAALQGRIASHYKKLTDLTAENDSRRWGMDFTSNRNETKAVSDATDLLAINKETTTTEDVQALHKKLTGIERRLESDLLDNRSDRVLKLITDAGDNISKAVSGELRKKAVAVVDEYKAGTLTYDAANRRIGELFGTVLPMVRKAEARQAPPRRDGQKPGSTAKFGEVADRNRQNRSRGR